MSLYASQIPPMSEDDEDNGAVSFAKQLDAGELLEGTPLVVELTSSDLTITNKIVSVTALVINETSVPIGEAVQFHVVGQLLATAAYTLKITAVTDASPARTLNRYVRFTVTA